MTGRRIAAVVVATGLAVAVTAQDAAQAQLDRLLGLAMRSGLLREAAVDLVEEIGPRRAGTPNGRRAEDLAVDVFRRAGLPLVRREPFEVPLWQVQRASLAVVRPTTFEAQVVPLANSASTPGQGLLLRLVDAGYGTPEELAALEDAAGAALLVRTGAPAGRPWRHRSAKYAAAVEAGAAAFLLVPDRLDAPARAGTITLGGEAGPIPALGIPAATGAWFARLLARGADVQVRVTLLAERRVGEAANVVADLPGRERGEMILVGAHLDSWELGQGAGDNGTGTLVLWQVAQALVEQGQRPRRTVRFVSFQAEEIGLLGARAYVERHADDLESIRAMVNLDMPGRPTGFVTNLQPEAAPLLRSLAARLAGFGLDTEVPDHPSVYGDQQPFLLAGVPLLGLRGTFPEELGRAYHSAGDTYDKLELGDLQQAAAVTAALVWRLAEAEPLPTRRRDPAEVLRRLAAAGIGEEALVAAPAPHR